MDQEWEKVLYKKPPNIPDNYTDEKFLEGLKHNVHFKPVPLKNSLVAVTRVSVQLSIVVLFFVIFFELKFHRVEPETVFAISTVVVSVGYAMFVRSSQTLKWMDHARSVIYFLIIGYASTPILQTLTNTISTDTIYAMAALLMVVHLLFHHYGVDAACVSPYLSLNAALCGAICLASRLETTRQAFVLLTIAVESFALFPKLYDSAGHNLKLSFLVIVTSVMFVARLAPFTATLLFCSSLLFINVFCPCCFVSAQRFKNNIHGPWDEAMIR